MARPLSSYYESVLADYGTGGLRLLWLQAESESAELAAHLDRKCATLRALLGKASEDKVSDVLDKLNDLEDMVLSLRLGWIADEGRRGRRAAVRGLRDAWKARWGDPADPEVQERIKRQAAALMSRGKDAAERKRAAESARAERKAKDAARKSRPKRKS